MSSITPEALPVAPQGLRQDVFVGIGGLATIAPQPREQQVFSFAMNPVDASDIPRFVTERLPATGQPTLFEVKARLHSARPRIPPTASLIVRRTVLRPDTNSATVWRVDYWLEDETQGFAARRVVYGLDYSFPEAPDANPRVSTSEQSGPWPEAGLVVPEGEQLLTLIAALKQEASGSHD